MILASTCSPSMALRRGPCRGACGGRARGILSSDSQRALSEVFVEPLDQKVAEEKLVAGHVPEEQRLPGMERASVLGSSTRLRSRCSGSKRRCRTL